LNSYIREDDCLSFVQDKMMGNMRLEDGFTEEDEMLMYKNTNHVNYFIPSGNGFLCVSIYEEFVVIPFAWHIGKHGTLKEMVRLGKDLYKHYTIERCKPIYYTGLKNLYGHNSVEIAENLWMFEPKRYD